jgi:AmmeMemoRadiSam system protein A
MQEQLTPEERSILLRLARDAMECAVRGEALPPLHLSTLPARLSEPGASFVTLTIDGDLRGCIGTLQACQPLAEDVREHAIAAALRDPRFPPVTPAELGRIQIEIARLTPPVPLMYKDPIDLLSLLRPRVDGVVLDAKLNRRGTFLPQVWEKIPDPAEFLNNLCYKIGLEPDAWRHNHYDVFTYQAEEFHEGHIPE